jgi:hypothetical protein
MKNTRKYTAIMIALIVIGITSTVQAQTSEKVNISFAITGLDTFWSNTLTIDGTTYTRSQLPKTFTWDVGSEHIVTAITPLTAWDANYTFASWTNGNGLTGSTGTFITPSTATTVTANYQKVETTSVTFGFTSLDTYWGNTLIIDGVSYTRGQLPKTFTWQPGTEHAVTALTPLTAGYVGAPTYMFTGWTNGNGLTGTTGTFVTPDSAVTVTANYVESSDPLTTEITIHCSPTVINKYGDTTTTITGTLTSDSTGIVRYVELSYFDGVEWLPIQTTTTSDTGVYSYEWDVPETVANGQYAIKAEFLGDSTYESSSATTGSGSSNLFVVPEYSWGGLSVVLVCFAAFLVVKARRRTTPKA